MSNLLKFGGLENCAFVVPRFQSCLFIYWTFYSSHSSGILIFVLVSHNFRLLELWSSGSKGHLVLPNSHNDQTQQWYNRLLLDIEPSP